MQIVVGLLLGSFFGVRLEGFAGLEEGYADSVNFLGENVPLQDAAFASKAKIDGNK